MKLTEQTLYRIIQGRLLYKKCGLALFIHEPNKDLIFDSYEIYNEVYDKAYLNEVFIEEEILQVLIENNLWTPLDDREADKIDDEVKNLKVEAFESFIDHKKLNRIKREIKAKEKRGAELRGKKHTLDYLTCEGLATYCRWNWLIAHSTYTREGQLCDWGNVDLTDVMGFYDQNTISPDEYRYIARNDPWRSMWIASQKQGSNVFGFPSACLNKDQLTLCMFSTMYDNVKEHPECPDEKIIEDDDCLDGWFIIQKRKADKDKNEKNTENLIKNPKIANSPEIFIMAPNAEVAKNIYDLNDLNAKNLISQREQTMKGKEKVKETDFFDVQQDLMIRKNQAMVSHVKGQK